MSERSYKKGYTKDERLAWLDGWALETLGTPRPERPMEEFDASIEHLLRGNASQKAIARKTHEELCDKAFEAGRREAKEKVA